MCVFSLSLQAFMNKGTHLSPRAPTQTYFFPSMGFYTQHIVSGLSRVLVHEGMTMSERNSDTRANGSAPVISS